MMIFPASFPRDAQRGQTSEALLVEVANGLSKLRWRALAAALIHEVRSDSDVTVMAVPTRLFERGLELYERQQDKEWGLTDCISFSIMGERGIRAALAYDDDFAQAGFHALLREDPPAGSKD